MEDLLELNKVASAIKTEIILPLSNKTTKAHTPLVLMGTSMNVMTEPLHQTNKALPEGLHEMVVANGTVGALQTQRWAKEGRAELTVEERRKLLFEKLELSGPKSWTEENKERALNLLAKYHDIFTLEDREMGCTEATKHKIKVTDPKPFKERLGNIPSGLLEEVKEHLDHMLDMGEIKPSK